MAIFDRRTHPRLAGGHRQPRLRDHGTRRHVLPGAQTSEKLILVGENVMQFVAASKRRGVYVVDRIGRLRVLGADSGARLDCRPTENVPIRLANTDTDRIYLVDNGGLVQCLREVEQTEPIVHGKDRKEAAKAEEQPAVVKRGHRKRRNRRRRSTAAPKEQTAPKEQGTPAQKRQETAGAVSWRSAGKKAVTKGRSRRRSENANPFYAAGRNAGRRSTSG